MARRPVKKDPHESTLLTEKDLAAPWDLQPTSVANMRSQGRGPQYVKIATAVGYRLGKVTAHGRLNGKR